MSPPLRLLVVDDNPIVRLGLIQILAGERGAELVAEAGNGCDALALAVEVSPDVVLLDVRMPVKSGLDILDELVAQCPVLMLTQTDEAPTIQDCLRRGASGYFVYGAFDAAALVHAVQTVAAGGQVFSPGLVASLSAASAPAAAQPSGDNGPPEWALAALSEREREVMALVVRGVTNQDIAAELFLSYKTVERTTSTASSPSWA